VGSLVEQNLEIWHVRRKMPIWGNWDCIQLPLDIYKIYGMKRHKCYGGTLKKHFSGYA